MQSLFYRLFSGKEQLVDFYEYPKEDFETLVCPTDQLIIQIHRKIKLLTEFKKYIQLANKDKNTVYYKYIINTNIYESQNKKIQVYTMVAGMFGTLYVYRTSDDSEDFFRTLAFIEL